MKKYGPFLLFLLIVIFVYTLKLIAEYEEEVPVWEYVLSEDQESYLIKAYSGDEESITIKETFNKKPIIGFHQDFVMPFRIKSLTLSVNLEQFNLDNNYNIYINNLVIPENSKLKSISCSTRFERSSFELMYVPKDTSLCVNSFLGNNSIKTFDVHPDNIYYTAVNGVLFNKDISELIYFPSQYESKEYIIPLSVTSILAEAFFEQLSLDSLFISESVTSIGEYAFAFSNIETITFSPLTTIHNPGNYIFREMKSMKHFDVPDSVTELYGTFSDSYIESVAFGENSQLTTIGHTTFQSTRMLKELTLPKSLTTIVQTPFNGSAIEVLNIQSNLTHFSNNFMSGMSNLIELNFLEEQSNLFYENGIMTINQGKDIIFYLPQDESVTTLYIDDQVERIHDYVIHNRSNVMNYEVDENNPYLKSLDGVIFSHDLTQLLYYPPSNTSISYQVPDGTVHIADFDYVYRLQSLMISESVETIGSFAYTNLESVVFLGESKLEVIPTYAFRQTKLMEIVIPKSVKVIGYGAFDDTPLESLEFEEGSLLELIEPEAFQDTLLKTVILPPNDITIRSKAFYSDYLKYVYIPIEVTDLEENVFNNTTEIKFYLEESFLIEELNLPTFKSIILVNQTVEDFLEAIDE